MSDAGQKKPRALGRGLDDLIRPAASPAEDVNATGALLGKMKRAPLRPPTSAPDATVARKETVAPHTIVAPPATVAPEPTPLVPEETVAPDATVAPQEIVKGYAEYPHDLYDRVMPTLDPYEQVVLMRLCRLSWGFKSDRCKVGYKKLMEACNLKKRKLGEAVAMLEKRGLIARPAVDQGSADRGTVYEILLPPPPGVLRATVARKTTVASGATVARDAPNKIKALKEIDKGEVSDFKNCPDCRGLAWLYPNGPDGGVVRCLHPELKK